MVADRHDNVTGTLKLLRSDGNILRSQDRTLASGTMTVMTPIPEKAPAGILTVQSPFLIAPPRRPLIETEMTFVVDVRTPAFDPAESVVRPRFGPAACSGASGEVEHPTMSAIATKSGRAAIRIPWCRLKKNLLHGRASFQPRRIPALSGAPR